MLSEERPRGARARSDCAARVTHASGNGPRRHSWLSASWNRNKGAIASIGGKLLTGNFIGAGTELANDAKNEAARVVKRTQAPPEAQAVMLAQAENAINAGAAAAGINPPSYLNPLGAQGSQVVAIGGRTVSVNTLAMIGGGIVLVLLVLMVAKR